MKRFLSFLTPASQNKNKDKEMEEELYSDSIKRRRHQRRTKRRRRAGRWESLSLMHTKTHTRLHYDTQNPSTCEVEVWQTQNSCFYTIIKILFLSCGQNPWKLWDHHSYYSSSKVAAATYWQLSGMTCLIPHCHLYVFILIKKVQYINVSFVAILFFICNCILFYCQQEN